MKYNSEPYNKADEKEQWIRITDGCPNNCEYCYCPTELKEFEIPQIIRNKVKILDMNILQVNKELISKLPQYINRKQIYYELTCGIDYRVMTQDIANNLKKQHFQNIRLAWDFSIDKQYKIKDCINYLLKAGYKSKDLMVFMISDWRIPFEECLMKLFLINKWGCQVSDCWYDNVKPPNYQCDYWTLEECKTFRSICAVINQSITFGIYPDLPRVRRTIKKIKELVSKEQQLTLAQMNP